MMTATICSVTESKEFKALQVARLAIYHEEMERAETEFRQGVAENNDASAAGELPRFINGSYKWLQILKADAIRRAQQKFKNSATADIRRMMAC